MAMTRPRMSCWELSWSVELAVVRNTIEAAPSGTSRTAHAMALGATEAAMQKTAKVTAEPTSRGRLGRALFAAVSAPTNEPAAITARRAP